MKLMMASSLHEGSRSSETLLRTCKILIIPISRYGKPCLLSSKASRCEWESEDKEILKIVPGLFTLTKRTTLKAIVRMKALEQRQSVAIGTTRGRIQARGKHYREKKEPIKMEF